VLERLSRIDGADVEVAIRVARNLGGAQTPELLVHRLARGLGSADQIDLVAFDDPAGDIRRIVGFELAGRERLDAAQQPGMHADRGADEIVVENVLQAPGGRLPAYLAHLARLRAAAAVGVGFGRVVIMAGFGGP
jgi:hypothetical protein